MARNPLSNIFKKSSDKNLDIFVSYAQDDKPRIAPEIQIIRDMGYNPWYYEGTHRSNNSEDILEHVKNCDLFVVFVTDNSTSSNEVETEFRYAIHYNKDIIAIFFDEFEEIEMSSIWKFELLNVEHIYKRQVNEKEYVSKFAKCIENFNRLKSLKSESSFGVEKPYIFVSYDDDDYQMVFKEVRIMQSMGCNVWFYERGDNFGNTHKTIDECELFLVYLTQNSIASRDVVKEIEYATTHEKQILLVQAEDIDEMGHIIEAFNISQIIRRDHDEFEYYSRLMESLEHYGVKPKDPTNSKLVPGKGREPIPAYEGQDPYIFISYAHKDGYRVFPEIKLFQERGYKVWYDDGITPGNEWLRDILNHLDGSSIFVVFLTKNSAASVNVKKEIQYAIYKNKFILPILLESFSEIEMDRTLEAKLNNSQAILKANMIDENEYIYKFTKGFENGGYMPPIDYIYDSDSGYIKRNTFSHLNQMIQSGAKKITLKSDIVLDSDDDAFLTGIALDADDIHIDGYGHSIDAKNEAHILNITGRNISFEDIIFKNAFSEDNGGAISIKSSSCSFENCKFANNKSRKYGGAISIENGSELTFENCVFESNAASWAGAIYNEDNDLKFTTCKFSENISDNGEVIVSNSINDITLERCMPKNLKIVAYSNAELDDGGFENEGFYELEDDESWNIDVDDHIDWNIVDATDLIATSSQKTNSISSKKVKIYIGGSFSDMHAERDYLLKEVFPKLSEWCDRHFIELFPIDMRWGISEETTSNNNTIEKCLSLVDQSRPFFICLLGQRRGWVPNFKYDLSMETFAKYQNIESLDGQSIIEMEIEHALKPLKRFNYPECSPSRHCIFLFRDESYLDKLTPYQRLIYTDDYLGEEDAIRQYNEAMRKTKERIRYKKELEDRKNDNDESKINILIDNYKGTWNRRMIIPELSHYPHDEGKGGLTNFECDGHPLSEIIIKQLKNEIEIEFEDYIKAVGTKANQLNLKLRNLYLESPFFIPNRTTDFLSSYIKKEYDNKTCLVISPNFNINTMLLAKFAIGFSQTHEIPVYKRFCTVDVTSTLMLWQSICDEAGIQNDEYLYPNSIKELKRNINDILNRISQNGKTVLIIDGINKLHDGLEIFNWLDRLPDNIKLIISAKYEPKLKNIINSPNILHRKYALSELSDDEKIELIKLHSSLYLKEFDERMIQDICSFEGSQNPLYLKIMLDELILFGSFDKLNEEIRSFGKTPQSAYNHVLERLENDEKYFMPEHMKDSYNIVPKLFSLLAIEPLSEAELISILSYGLGGVDIHDNVMVNLRQMKQHLMKNEYGQYEFLHDEFKTAIMQRYELEDECIKLLADYFMDESDPGRNNTFNCINPQSINKLVRYLYLSGRYTELDKTLSSYNFIRKKLDLFGINELLSDYEYSEDESIELIKEALILSAPVLSLDKDQLPNQLWGRLSGVDDSLISDLLDELIENSHDKWLKSTYPSLHSPNELIIQKFDRDFDGVNHPIEITPDKKFIYQKGGKLYCFDLFNNNEYILDMEDSRLIKIEVIDKFRIIAAYDNVAIKELDIHAQKIIKEFEKVSGEITDIFYHYSDNRNMVYISTDNGIFTINLLNNDKLRKEMIYGDTAYTHIIIGESGDIIVCDGEEFGVFGEQTTQSPSNSDDYNTTPIDSNDEICFIGQLDEFLVTISKLNQMEIVDTGNLDSKCTSFIGSPNDSFKQALILKNTKKIVTITSLGVLRVWSITNENELNVILEQDHQTGILPTDIGCFENDEENIFIGGAFGISIADLNKKKFKENDNNIIKHLEEVLSIDIYGNHMITSSSNGELFTWDLDKQLCVNRYSNDFRCNSVSFNSADSKMVFAGFKSEKDGRRIYKIVECFVSDDMWDTTSTENDLPIEKDYHEIINSDEIISIAQNNSGPVFIEESKLVIAGDEIILNEVATTLTCKSNSNDAFVGFEDGNIIKYPAKTVFDKITESSVSKIITTDNDRLIAGYADGSIRAFDLNGNYLDIELEQHEKRITCICMMDAKILVSASKDSTLKIWNIETSECIYTYYADIYITSINIHGNILVLGDALGNVNFFNLENFKLF